MKFIKLAFGLVLLGAIGVGSGVMRMPHYISAVWDNTCETVGEWINPELHIQAARKQIEAIEKRIEVDRKHLATCRQQIDSLEAPRRDIERDRVAATDRVRRQRDFLVRNRTTLDAFELHRAGQESRGLERAFREATAAEEGLHRQLDAHRVRQKELESAISEIERKVETAKVRLEDRAARLNVEQAEREVEEAARILDGLSRGNRDRVQVRTEPESGIDMGGLVNGSIDAGKLIDLLNGLLKR